jgi:hypothetical protein
MHDLNTPLADHLGRAEGLIRRDAAAGVSAEMGVVGFGRIGRVD